MGSALAVLWAWVCSGLGLGRSREMAEADSLADALVLEAGAEQGGAETSASGPAYLQDHGAGQTRGSEGSRTSKIEAGDERGRDGPRVLGPPRIDGGTAWGWEAPKGVAAWACWREVKAAAQRDDKVVELVTADGEVVEWSLDRGRPGSGTLVLSTGWARVELRRRWAEIQITQLAAEVEGVEVWAERELGRWAWWLLGLEIEDRDELVGPGLETRRIEICVEVAGLVLRPGDEQRLVSRADVWAVSRRPGELDGYGAGTRAATPSSLAIYGKRDQLYRLRGPEHAALLGRLHDEGLLEGEPVARVEVRAWGRALRLRRAGGGELDLAHPGAPLDGDKLAMLWADSTRRHRVVEPRESYEERQGAWEEGGRAGDAPRLRDEPVAPWWESVQAAAGVEGVKLTRVAAVRQLAASRSWAVDALATAAAGVEVLHGGAGDGAVAKAKIDEAVAGSRWAERMARARARHGGLVKKGGER